MWPDRPDKTWPERCDATDNLEVHHLHYGTLRHEADEDLVVLCRYHHLLTHLLARKDSFGQPIFDSEQDAIAVIEDAEERLGGIDKVSPDDLSVPAHNPYIQHLLDKDD
jgi:hypothetical protein